MKKNIKKCFALLLAVVMTLTMALAVFAAEPNNTTGGRTTVAIASDAPQLGKLTITKGGSYSIYKVFSANQKPGETTYTWTADSEYTSVLAGRTVENIATLKGAELKTLATALAGVATEKTRKATVKEA